MDERKDERSGEQQDDRQYRRKLSSGPGRLWAGLFLLLVGGVLLLDQMGFPLPDWLFSWHILLIAVGLFLGLRHNFRGGAWLIMILVGGSFLIQDFYPKAELRRFIAPCVLIFIGFIIMFRPRNRWRQHPWKDEWREQMQEKWRRHQWNHNHHDWNRFNNQANPPTPNQSTPNQSAPEPQEQPQPQAQPQPEPQAQPTPGAGANGPAGAGHTGGAFANSGSSSSGQGYTSEDYIDTTSVFGGVHKKVVSKNFKGGDIVTFLGGSEIDLSQAEINGTARLDVTQVMGGTKIIVPAHWEVRSEVTALFAGFEDKRQQPAIINPDKVLIIDGTSIFGGIELKNY